MDEMQKVPVVIYGGGIAGAFLARQLSKDIEVLLVDPVDYFEVPMAAPRNLVIPEFADKAIIPFKEVLPNVKHICAKLITLMPDSGVIVNSEAKQSTISAQITVLATGSHFSNGLTRGISGTSLTRKSFYQAFNQRLLTAKTILIVGGGPIGVEIAGEISENFPDKTITILESGFRILRGTSEKLAHHAQKLLMQRGVKIITGDRVQVAQEVKENIFTPGGEITTLQGLKLNYDLLLWCIGGTPNTSYMREYFSNVLTPEGRIKINPNLQVLGQQNILALGDITNLEENKMAWHTQDHVPVAAANIRSLLKGQHTLKTYKPKTNDQRMVVTLGSKTGVMNLPLFGVIYSAWFNRLVKAKHMLVPMFRGKLGIK